MTKQYYKERYLKLQEGWAKLIFPFLIVLLAIFILEKLNMIFNLAPQLYAVTTGLLMLSTGILGIRQNYYAYKAEFVQYRKTKRSPIITTTGRKAKKIALVYITFFTIFFISTGMFFVLATIYSIINNY